MTKTNAIQKEIALIEAQLIVGGIKLQDFLDNAGIHRRTWGRWKEGILPSMRLWLEVLAARDRVVGRG